MNGLEKPEVDNRWAAHDLYMTAHPGAFKTPAFELCQIPELTGP